jgi:two-component system, OmpR family, KDP operon response regulator KdpE
MIQDTLSTISNVTRATGVDLDAFRGPVKPRILIVDDDPEYVTMLKLILRQADFDVSGVLNSRSALEKCVELKPDVILLDVMMPDRDGYDTFQWLRKQTNTPVIFVSAAPRSDNLLRALEAGADDYISKPFHNSELIARIKKILRQSHADDPVNTLVLPGIDLSLDLEDRSVFVRGQQVHLLPREFSLLKILAEHAPRNVSYEKITRHLWGQDDPRTRANLKTVAFALRRKLEIDPEHPRMLVNNRSVGYQLITNP